MPPKLLGSLEVLEEVGVAMVAISAEVVVDEANLCYSNADASNYSLPFIIE